MAKKKRQSPRFQQPSPATTARPITTVDEPVTVAPDDGDDLLYTPPIDAAPVTPSPDSHVLYVPEPASDSGPGLFERVASTATVLDRDDASAPQVEPEPAPSAEAQPAPTEITSAGVAMIERQVRDLRGELALFIEHANASMARIDRLLTAMRNVDAEGGPEAEPPPAEDASESSDLLPDSGVTARGRGFVGGWRPRRE